MDKQATLILRLKDLATAGLSKTRAALNSLKTNLVALGLTFGALKIFVLDSIRSFAEEEKAVQKLDVALKNQGVTNRAVRKDLQAYASELQRTTTYGDETIIGTQALLTTFGLLGDQAKQATKASLDLASGLGIDLRAATMIVGKAFAGSTGELSRYGIVLKEGIPANQKFAEVMRLVNERFGGAAQAELGTFAGRVTNLKNQIGDLQERIGGAMIPVLETWVGWLKSATEYIDKLTSSEKAEMSARQAKIADQKEEIKRTSDQIAEQHKIIGMYREGSFQYENATRKLGALTKERESYIRILKAEQEALSRETPAVAGPAAIGMPAPTGEGELEKLQEQAQAKIDHYTYTASELERIETESLAKRLHANQDNVTATNLLAAQRTATEKSQGEKRQQAFENTLDFISNLSTSKNKELAAIGKTIGTARAIMNTAEAVTVALKSAPPPFNFILAGLVGAAGAAQVATIQGVSFAEGGMVMPRMGGMPAIIGEGGSREAVIPLDDSRTKDALRETVGGGPEIHVHAGTIIADPYSVHEFARQIDRELFKLRRNRESNFD